jgi:glycine/D-amino acid oxidase-like deaminating enzyme
MKDYASYSFWLEQSGDDLTPRDPLDGSTTVDVAILGAGFTGLWTAYHLLRRDPTLKVAILEAEIAGFGASGRNGGWCFAGFPLSPTELTERYSRETARAISLAMYDSVDDVGAVCEREGIDAHYAKGGELEIARAGHEMPTIEKMYEEFRSIGLEDHYEMLDADQTAERIQVANAIGSFWNREGAAVQPARLARGLARAVERHGGTIYERTRVLDFTPGPPAPMFHTDRGDVTAKVIVLAGEAYLAEQPKMKKRILPITSHIVLTEPLSDDVWGEIGWERREVVGGFGTEGAYLNHTADGRIAFGPYRSHYPFGSQISDGINLQQEIFEHGRKSARSWFPMLEDVEFTHAWGGVLGMPRDHMPTMAYNRPTGVAFAFGYTGDGVATTNLSGRVLTHLITETQSELTQLPMTRHRPRRWEPEPLRWIGSQLVMWSRHRNERNSERTGKPSEGTTLAERLWRS